MGWYVFLDFKITLHIKDRNILDKIKNSLGVGVISKHGEHLINYSVKSIKDIQLIINHFDNFPLKTKKLNDYKYFKLAFEIIKNKEHLKKEGLDKLLILKSFMNKGLSPELKLNFPNIKFTRYAHARYAHVIIESDSNKIINSFWFSGFTSGEGSFQINIKKSQTLRHDYQISLRFSIGQHSRDEELLRSLINYLDCGIVQKKNK